MKLPEQIDVFTFNINLHQFPAEIEVKWKRVGEEATAIQVKPRKADVHVTHFGLAWAPFWRTAAAEKAAYR